MTSIILSHCYANLNVNAGIVSTQEAPSSGILFQAAAKNVGVKLPFLFPTASSQRAMVIFGIFQMNDAVDF